MTTTDSCSAASLRVGESLAGTAPHALGWIAVAQPGPFGPKAFTESHFPVELGAELSALAEAKSIRPQLIRGIGAHADKRDESLIRTVYLASSAPGKVGLLEMTIDDPRVLLSVNFAALANGDLANVHPEAVVRSGPVLLVCTHGKRDLCCARLGRPVATELCENPNIGYPVWETSHLGGHRFAPTAVALPHGWVYGRVSEARTQVAQAVEAGKVLLPNARGRSSLTAEWQVADLVYRQENGIVDADATRLTTVDDGVFEVGAAGFESRQIVVNSVLSDDTRPESCSKNVTQVTRFTHEWL